MSQAKPTYTDDTYREYAFHTHEQSCVHCGERDNLVVHHVNGDRSDSSIENLIVLCRGCHQAIHGYKSELPPFLDFLRTMIDKDSLSYGPIGGNTIASYQTMKVENSEYNTLEQIANKHEYSSMDEAVTHVLREAGYDV